MLIDSHCHLPDLTEANAAKEQIYLAEQNEVAGFINIGTNLADSLAGISVADSFKNVFTSIAVYPHEDQNINLDTIRSQLGELVHKSKKVVAIGECGIDITDDASGRTLESQLELFEMQIKLAVSCDLPLIIHNRNGDTHVLDLLNRYKGPRLQGVVHCFSSPWVVAQKFLDLGFYLSFSAFITYPSKTYLFETVKNVPINCFLVETDSPFLSPQGMRDKPNQPKNVKIVAQKVADIRNASFLEISDNSFRNTCKLFNLPL